MDDISLFLPPSFEEPRMCTPGPDGHCALCADEGLPGQVLALQDDNMALVAMSRAEQAVALDLVEDAQVGDWVLVHLGFAIARLEGGPQG